MASLRRVRKNFRKEVLQLIKAGEGNLKSLMQLADAHFGSNDCGYHAVLRAFHASEVNNAVSQLRLDGEIETVGKSWKSTEDLQSEDVDIITLRRMKRLRGEAKSLARFAHEHGRTEAAISASHVVSIVNVNDGEPAIAEEQVAEK
ncbi:MAG: hypothetical protein EB060_10890 [Proteobacteria bacterium]|nr:hypothetical protein [Pseudomonadota bacterium]